MRFSSSCANSKCTCALNRQTGFQEVTREIRLHMWEMTGGWVVYCSSVWRTKAWTWSIVHQDSTSGDECSPIPICTEEYFSAVTKDQGNSPCATPSKWITCYLLEKEKCKPVFARGCTYTELEGDRKNKCWGYGEGPGAGNAGMGWDAFPRTLKMLFHDRTMGL